MARETPKTPAPHPAVRGAICERSEQPGGILAALRRSPLVGADLDLSRAHGEGREIDL